MPFVVEDGSGKVDANSYATIAEADEYFTQRLNNSWTGANNVKEAALIKATDYIEGRFASRFIGGKFTQEQALSWPRIDAEPYLTDDIPSGLKRPVLNMRYAPSPLTLRLILL